MILCLLALASLLTLSSCDCEPSEEYQSEIILRVNAHPFTFTGSRRPLARCFTGPSPLLWTNRYRTISHRRHPDPPHPALLSMVLKKDG
ncbi:MAG: hypothetical protein QNL24_11180 [Akkermansiaceae bacterium]